MIYIQEHIWVATITWLLVGAGGTVFLVAGRRWSAATVRMKALRFLVALILVAHFTLVACMLRYAWRVEEALTHARRCLESLSEGIIPEISSCATTANVEEILTLRNSDMGYVRDAWIVEDFIVYYRIALLSSKGTVYRCKLLDEDEHGWFFHPTHFRLESFGVDQHGDRP